MSSIKLDHLYDPEPSTIAETVYGFLAQLGGPTAIHITGHDTRRCRVVVTLLHGNEPSGLKAVGKYSIYCSVGSCCAYRTCIYTQNVAQPKRSESMFYSAM
jgi:hypothetical protein